MMKTLRALALFASAAGGLLAHAQAVNVSQAVTVAGLRSSAGHGSFPAALYASDGSLYVLYDQADGIRVLHLNAAANTVLGQAQLGAAGDSALAMAMDPAGNVYVTGTSTSGTLSGTSGAAFVSRADTSTNSFLAKFSANLQVVFVTFLGAGRTAAASVSATADAVFVTGITFNAAFPVTANGIEQTPATGSSENGFVERFGASGSTLVYATYLTGANGNTMPAAVVADAADDAYVVGTTAASGFPTVAALVPSILGTSSGFVSKLTPAGDGFTFSTFVPGAGITGLAIDSSTSTLLLSGNVALGQFPVATVQMPLTSAAYQSLLRLPLDGQSVTESVVLVPGTQSQVAAGPGGTAWVSGALSTPLFPGTSQPLALFGDSFAVHVAANSAIDQTMRFGGQPAGSFSYAGLVSAAGLPAVSADGATVLLPGTLSATIGTGLAGTQGFDLPYVAAPNAALLNTLRDVAASCGTGAQCIGTAGLLTAVASSTSAVSVAVSSDSFPNLIVRNLGSSQITGLVITASGYSLSTNCASTLNASSACVVAVSGSGPGTITVSAANAASETYTFAASAVSPDPLAVLPVELDFGIQTAASTAATRTLTVSNLSAVTQTFSSALDNSSKSLPYSLVQTGSDCAGGGSGPLMLAAGASCHVTVGLSVSSSSANDGPIKTAWKIGTHDVTVTAFAQAAALYVSASEVNFGTQFVNGLRLPRYLYISNSSTTSVAHAAVTAPAGSPFTVVDECPDTLEARSICRITLGYQAAAAPSSDAVTLVLDQGLSVLLTGETLPQQGTAASTANPNLMVSPTAIVFTAPVVATELSGSAQAVVVKNTGSSAVALAVAVSGDFTEQNGCPVSLTGGSSCMVLVTFAPSESGTRTGLLAVTGGTGFAPAYVSLSGTALDLLPSNNGIIDLGQTLAGEPTVVWVKVQQSLTSLTASTNSSVFGVAIVEDTGYGHGTLPAGAFGQRATGTCNNCYLGIQFLSQATGLQGATLSLSTVPGGEAETLALTATALPISGLLLTPISQDFGTISVNSSSGTRTFTLANLVTPAASAGITSVTVSGDFHIAANATGGASCSGGLPSTASCFVPITFAPTATGQRNGTLTVVTTVGTATAMLTGFGEEDPGFAINPTELDFNNVPGSAAGQQSVVLSNTGTSPATVGTLSSSDPSFAVASTCGTLAPGATCAATVTFTAGFAMTSGTLSVPVTTTLNGQSSTVVYAVTLMGNYTAQIAGLEIVPGQVDFGTASVGALSTARQFTVNNLTAKTVAVSLSLPRQFPLAMPGGCATLAAYGSCTISTVYLPATAGEATGTLFAQAVPTDGSAALQGLSYMQGYGAGAGTLSITGGLVPNAPLGFGQVASGQSAVKVLTLTNTGSTTLTVRRVTSQPPFLSTTTCGSALAAAQSCTVSVSYSPVDQVASGTTALPRSDAGMLVIESDAASGAQTIELTGSAIPAVVASPANPVMLATFTLSNSALTFATTTVGNASAAQTVTLVNTGTATIHLLGTMAPPDFMVTTSCGTIQPGASCTFSVVFAPTTVTTAALRAGTLEISTDAATSLEFVTLMGISAAASVTVSPAALDFGTVAVGASGTLGVTVTNNGGAAVTFSSVSATGDYSVANGSCPASGMTLVAGGSCMLQVMFTPTAAGIRVGTLSVATSGTALPLTVSLTGVGVVAALQVTPGALAFGATAVGAPANMVVTLLNTGTAAVTGIGTTITGVNAADFAVTVPCSTTMLAPNQGCAVTVTFTPGAVGARTATLAVASSDPTSPATVALTGTGVAAGSFTLSVNAASVAVKSGSPASYSLAVTPVNGFVGAVVLACSAMTPGTYATCSISPSTVVLNGAAQASTVTINTITSASVERPAVMTYVLAWLWAPLLFLRRRGGRRMRRGLLLLAPMVGIVFGAVLTGCGGSGGGSSGLLYTPAGSYQYRVTATSTNGTQLTQSVTLTLVVQ